MKKTTLCYPVRGGRVLLAMKKRGFGAGKWNGPGGKWKQGETIEETCRRETKEEIGIDIGVLDDRGTIRFFYPDHPGWDNECRIFVTTDFSGEPVESDEMKPSWFPIDAIPVADMWADDGIWLPGVLAGGRVYADFHFDADGLVTHWEYQLPE
jgi:8-oxo-dGTP pyrophosphatase MutT (NUDIX family)